MKAIELLGFFFFMKKSVVRISSLLYKDLFDLGGDKLIAVFSILKSSRNGKIKYYSYTARNNKKVSGYSLLRKETCLSLHTLKKYVPMLMDLGLCEFHTNGDFSVLGNRILKKIYNTKLVPITIGKNFTDTQYNSFSVRLHSSEKSQRIMISKKQHRRELIFKLENPRTMKEYKASKNVLKRYGRDISVTDNVVLSNQGYSKLKGKDGSKSSGSYYKSKLVEKGIVHSSRKYKLVEKMSYAEYLQFKKYNAYGFYTYLRGCLAIEQIATMTAIDTTRGKFEKGAPISMEYDFIGWLTNTDKV